MLAGNKLKIRVNASFEISSTLCILLMFSGILHCTIKLIDPSHIIQQYSFTMELQPPTTLPLLPDSQPALVDPTNNEKEKIRKNFPKTLMIVICILQIGCGILVLSFQAIAFLTHRNPSYSYMVLFHNFFGT